MVATTMGSDDECFLYLLDEFIVAVEKVKVLSA